MSTAYINMVLIILQWQILYNFIAACIIVLLHVTIKVTEYSLINIIVAVYSHM